jgi:hypothetical protein
MALQMNCPVCGGPAVSEPQGDRASIECPRCGSYPISGTAESIIRDDTKDAKIKLSAWIRGQFDAGDVPLITSATIEWIRTASRPSVSDRAQKLLAYSVRHSDVLGTWVHFEKPELIAVTWSETMEEVQYLAKMLHTQGLLKVYGDDSCVVTPSGYTRFDELRLKGGSGDQAFVAMWFDRSVADAFDQGFALGIAAAGYSAFRVDKKEHSNKIDDEIVAEIRRSRFVVADFTGHRGGVYFEAGFALGLGIPVIWTCRVDYLRDLHFDIRQYNCLEWSTPADIPRRLERRIVALIGQGPRMAVRA